MLLAEALALYSSWNRPWRSTPFWAESGPTLSASKPISTRHRTANPLYLSEYISSSSAMLKNRFWIDSRGPSGKRAAAHLADTTCRPHAEEDVTRVLALK